MTLYIAGMEKCALAEFGNGLTCVVFLQGCDMRCSYCQNADLIKPYSERVMDADASDIIAEIPWEDMDALCITGGEPLWSAHRSGGVSDLVALLAHARRLRKKTNLDTNGLYSNDEKTRVLCIIAPFLTSISVDIKYTSSPYLSHMVRALRMAEAFNITRFRMVLYEGRWHKKACIDSGVQEMERLGIKKIKGVRNGMEAPMMSDEECKGMQEEYKGYGIDLVV